MRTSEMLLLMLLLLLVGRCCCGVAAPGNGDVDGHEEEEGSEGVEGRGEKVVANVGEEGEKKRRCDT